MILCVCLMVAKYEAFSVFKGVPSAGEVAKMLNLLTVNKGFFVDRELVILLTPIEASRILGIHIERSDIGDSTLRDLVTREEIRRWSNLPKMCIPKKGQKEGISLLSVLEYMTRHSGGLVGNSGEFSSDSNQVALQKDVLGRILAQVPDWKARIASCEAA